MECSTVDGKTQTTHLTHGTEGPDLRWHGEYRRGWAAAQDENRALRQALMWCVVNDGESLADHPHLLQRFREILGIEGQTDAG